MEEGETQARLGRTDGLTDGGGRHSTPPKVVVDGETDPARHPKGRFGTGEDLRGPGLAPLILTELGHEGEVGLGGQLRRQRGRRLRAGKEDWRGWGDCQGCSVGDGDLLFGRDAVGERSKRCLTPAPHLPCPAFQTPAHPRPSAWGPGVKRTPSTASLKLPSKGSNTLNPSRPKPTEQFLTASHGKGFALLRLYRCFTSLKIFSGIRPHLPVAAAAAQVPSLALKDTRSRLQP